MAKATDGYRRNHFVPESYQRRFLPAGDGELYVFDKYAPKEVMGGDGKMHPIKQRSVLRRGVDKFCRQDDLYTTMILGQPNTDIEKMLFGVIDTEGAKAIARILHWPYNESMITKDLPKEVGDPNRWLGALVEFINIQKLRTPHGLALLKAILAKTGQDISQETVMMVMQGLRHEYTSMLYEALWDIVITEQDEVGFIFSDDPVTLYNCAVPPFAPFTSLLQYDPIIYMQGTRVVYPLTSKMCLILTHLDHAKHRNFSEAGRARRNARGADPKIMFYWLDIMKHRVLEKEQVATINLLVKTRAKRYVAGGRESDLFPERLIKLNRWADIDDVLQHTGFAPKLTTTETVVKYKDGTIFSTNPYGESQTVPGWWIKARERRKAEEEAKKG